MLKYSVLYYKRTNKVHKNKGVTREDGILTIAPPPSCVCKLTSADDDNNDALLSNTKKSALDSDSDDDDCSGKFTSKKSKYQQMKKKMSNGSHKNKSGVIFSGVNSDISRRAFDPERGISEDDALVLSGQWECEIISVLSSNDNGGDSTKSRGGGVLNSTKSVGIGGGIKKKSSLMNKKPSVGLGSQRAPLGSLRKNPTAMKKQPLLQSKKKVGLGGSGIGVKRTLGSSTAAKAPPQPAAAAGGGKMKKDKMDSALASRTSKVPASLMRSSLAKRPRTVSGLGSTTTTQRALKSDNTQTNTNTIDFPGAKGERINVHASIRSVLRPHQREGIAFLWNCITGVNGGLNNAYLQTISGNRNDSFDDESKDEESISNIKANELKDGDVSIPRGAVLADEMGLGKTLMTISTIFAYHRLHRDRRFIVVCPSSLVSNWQKEFDKWLGKASQPKRVVVKNGKDADGLRNLKSFVPIKPNQSEVLILSYELFRMHVKVINKAQKIGILVVDEGHRLKNTNGSQVLTALNSISVESRILISGTPIQNNLSEFYSVADFAVPGILGDLSTFRKVYERPMSQANQKSASNSTKEKGRRQAKALDAITSQFVLRRLQKDILKSILPPRMELLLFCRPTERQCELYQGIANRASKSIASIGGIEEINNPLVLLTEARKLCTHPSLLSDDEVATDASLSGKLVVLGNLLDSIRRTNPTDKVVIISNYTSALTVIDESVLKKKGLSSVRLDGSVANKDRGPMVDSFNSGSVDHSFAFLLSSKAGGCGLNLIGANRLIMVDADWNPATDHQAMARVYRQGQTKPCFIYRMFLTGTVEEVIYQRQIQKGNLAKLANDGGSKKKGSSTKDGFSQEELRDCFTLKQNCQCDTKRKLGKQWKEYDGAMSLHSQGCSDEPLLGICGDDRLTYVRVVDDDEMGEIVASDEDDNDNEDSSSEDDMLSEESSSEEEAEFD